MKKNFLVVHNYGMGGLWAIISARSEREISKKFPNLKVISARPAWMSDEEYKKIASQNSYDIDDEPQGWLSKI